MKADEKQQAALLKALSHPVRLRILRLLRHGPCCASSTNAAIPVSQPNLSQHLRALREAGIIDFCQVGPKRCFYLCRPGLTGNLLDLLDREHPRIFKSPDDIKREAGKK